MRGSEHNVFIYTGEYGKGIPTTQSFGIPYYIRWLAFSTTQHYQYSDINALVLVILVHNLVNLL